MLRLHADWMNRQIQPKQRLDVTGNVLRGPHPVIRR